MKEGLATIIDYKTGKEHATYRHQLNKYASAMESMGIPWKIKSLLI